MLATTTKLPFCLDEVSVLIEGGQKLSYNRYVDPLYHNYIIVARNPLYPNVIKLGDGSFQQRRETMKQFNRDLS